MQTIVQTPATSPYLSALLSRQHAAHVNPLTATHMNLSASVANKRLAAKLTPLDATLTKNRGWGPVPRPSLMEANRVIPGGVPLRTKNLQLRPDHRELKTRRVSAEATEQ